MSGGDADLHEFLRRYPPRPYVVNRAYPPSEMAPIGDEDGLLLLNEVPANALRGRPRSSIEDNGEHCHLWVIDARGRPCVSEAPLPRLGGGQLRHTNLTGGGQASIGGEIWFDELPRIFLSGVSGRYPPADRIHLEAAEDLFRDVGFDVVALGWDHETDRPMRTWQDRQPGKDE